MIFNHQPLLISRFQSGFALLPVVLVIAVIASIALLINYQSAMNVSSTASQAEEAEVEYVAQAGLQHALWQARNTECAGDVTIPTTALDANSYIVTSTGGGTSTAYTLSVDQDAWIRSDNPTSNNGANADLHIRFETGIIEQPLVRFDLSALPANAQINSASLWFYIETGKEHPEGHITLHRITSDWIESDVTWESFNASYDATALGMIGAQASSDAWVQVNITSQVQAWVNGESNYGFLLNSMAEGVHGEYISSEGASGKQPRLEVVVGNGATSPLNIQATGTLANGNARTLNRVIVPAYQSPSTTVLQLGADSGEDAMLDSFYELRNYGGANYMQVHDNGSDWKQYPIIRFDLSKLPQSASVRSARLELHMQSLNAPGTATVHQVTRNWVEGTQAGGGQADGATWFTHDGTNNWTSAGGDYNATDVSETVINVGDTWVTLEIAPLVEHWLSGQPNYGVLIKPDNALKQAKFDSKEESNTAFHPKLTIEYACECGATCLLPQGSGNVLMVVGDDDPIYMAPSDAKLRDIFESWGYSVTLLQDNTSQTAYDNEVAINDVVYISETASSVSIGTKLTNAPIGVVNEQGNLNDELGMASAKANPIGSSVNIVDNSHYITYPFQSGSLEIYSKDMEGLVVFGTEAPDLQTLANWNAAGGLVVLDTGMQTTSGGTAAGRRVMLPLGRSTNSNFNWNYLNNNGRLLVQRALQWGTGNIAAVTVNLLMVVVDPNNLTTQEAAKKTLLESWGYTVNLIDESDSQTAFDDAVAVNKVVFITEDVTASTVNTKLVNATIGVVTEEANLADEFGFSETIFWGSGTQIKTEGTHFIVEPFPAGNVDILSVSESLAGLTGARAPDLEIVAESPAGIGPATLDSGAALVNGFISAGRRVFLPWGGNNMDVNHLTDDGLTILQRALEWGANTSEDTTSPIAHWKLDETSGFNAEDSASDNDGALTDGSDWIPALIDGGLDLDGNNDYVDVGGMDVSGSGLTLMGWFNADALPAAVDPRIVSKASSTAEADAWWQLSILTSTSNRNLRLRTKAGGNTSTLIDSSTNLNTGEWYFAVGTYDAGTGEMKLYLNGTEVASRLHAVGGTINTDATVPVAIGANGSAEQFFDGILDDVRVYDYALPAGEIADLYAANAPPSVVSYTELYQPWSATGNDTWQTVDLALFGVPANAVVEVAVVNSDTGKEYFGGVRAVGSSLQRRFALHEAEGGGVDAVTMHVQTDASSQIQHYSDNASRVSFILLGYWTGATYVERFESFSAGANDSWREHNLGSYGVGPNQVAEIVISQTSTSIEWLVGSRRSGSSLQRRISLHEAEGGGVDAVTMQVETDASSIVEVYAEANSVIDFHLIGYWSTPPGTYTEAGGMHGQATAASTWGQTNLAKLFGIPANSIAQFIMSNEVDNFERELGVRQVGSSLSRVINFQEAEDGGADSASLHVNVDDSSQIEWYSASGTADRYFYPIGWWVLN